MFSNSDSASPSLQDLNDYTDDLTCELEVPAEKWYHSFTKDTYTFPTGGAYHIIITAWSVCGCGCDPLEVYSMALDYITDFETDNSGWSGSILYAGACSDTLKATYITPNETTPAAPNEVTKAGVDEEPSETC